MVRQTLRAIVRVSSFSGLDNHLSPNSPSWGKVGQEVSRCWAWWHLPATAALRRQEQENEEFEVDLGSVSFSQNLEG